MHGGKIHISVHCRGKRFKGVVHASHIRIIRQTGETPPKEELMARNVSVAR